MSVNFNESCAAARFVGNGDFDVIGLNLVFTFDVIVAVVDGTFACSF